LKIAYLILAHNAPRHLKRLIAALQSPSASVFIHLDSKSDLQQFEHLRGHRVFFTEQRVPVYWGDYSQVEAILIMIREAFRSPDNFDRFVLLSGADYPLQSADYIDTYFEARRDTEFINIVQMPSKEANKPISRLARFNVRPGGSGITRVCPKLWQILGRLLVRRNYEAHFQGRIPYAGSAWWALSRSACAHILEFVAREVKVVRFFQNTICPDESFFQSILGNSPYRSAISRNVTYCDWSSGGKSPAFISEKQFALVRAKSHLELNDIYGRGEALFARKFADWFDVELAAQELEKESVLWAAQ
jgi:hypothetical protein